MLRKHLLGSLISLAILSSPFLLHAQSSPLTIQPSTGRVGIGTTTPGDKFHLYGGQFFLGDRGDNNCCAALLMLPNVFQTHLYSLVADGRFAIHKYGGSVNGEVFTILANGHVGINTAAPTSALHVNGTITKTQNNFEIDHPLDPANKTLVHSTIEGPEAGVYYRGEGQLVNGEAVIALPAYFEGLTLKKQRTVQLTPVGGWSPLYVDSEIVNGQFIVKTAPSGTRNQRFYWEVKAIRADVPEIVVEKNKKKPGDKDFAVLAEDPTRNPALITSGGITVRRPQ